MLNIHQAESSIKPSPSVIYTAEVGSGYTEAYVEKVEFEKGLVRLFISYTYLRGPYGEFKTECTVKVSNGEFDDLVCEEGKRADE